LAGGPNEIDNFAANRFGGEVAVDFAGQASGVRAFTGKVSPASARVKVCRTVVVKLGGKKGSVGSRAPSWRDDTVTVTNACSAAPPDYAAGKQDKPEHTSRAKD
jgi:hypothetical protein